MVDSNFYLEIYEPGSVDTVVGSWPSASTVSVAVGEVIHLTTLVTNEPPRRVRATDVQHVFWLRDGLVVQKVMVFTEAAP